MSNKYSMCARWDNGHGYDHTVKECETKTQVLGAVKLLMNECLPDDIAIKVVK